MTHGDRTADHERARELAAAQIDEVLAPTDAAWLADHLETCPSCAAVAAEYDAQHALLFSLRDIPVQPPRDLWARTSAAISAERPRGRGLRWRQLRRSPRQSSPLSLVPAVVAVAIIAVVGAGLLNGGRILPGGVTPTPIAIAAADLQVLALDSAGNLRLLSRSVDQVCPTGVTECGPAPTFSVAAVSSFGTVTNLYGAMSPTGGQVVVVSGGPGNAGVYVVPVKAPVATAKPSASSESSPVSPTASRPAATPTRAPDASGTSRPTDHASSSTPSPAVTPSSTPGGSTEPPASPPTGATASAPSDDSPTPSAAATPSPTPSDAGQTASTSTSGSPMASADVSSATLPPGANSASSAPSGPTPAPMTAIRIASDVTVVGAPVYSPDGSQLAFSATPSSGGAGPDIYVWTVGNGPARAITTDHGSWLAGWTSQGILVSRVDDGIPATFALDPATALATPVGPQNAWLPSLSPSGAMAAWWSGTVRLAGDGVTWLPDQGQVVLGAWPGGPGASATTAASVAPAASVASGTSVAPGAAQPQVLASGPIDGWQVRWDETGSAMALWVAPAGAGTSGRLSLYSVDPATGNPVLAAPMLDAAAATPDFSLRAGRLAWTAPSPDGAHQVNVLAWSGSTVYPTMTVVADGKGTVVP